MLQFLNKFERVIVHSLLVMLMLAVLASTVELAVLLVEQFMKPPRLFLLDMSELLPIFSFFLMVLIGVELIEVMKDYLTEKRIKSGSFGSSFSQGPGPIGTSTPDHSCWSSSRAPAWCRNGVER